jgi:sugar/nucleoside kinase (ribokinase family)
MKSSSIYDVVCIGNYTKDTIISPTGTRYVDGGGMNYAAHAAARLGCKVAVVTRLAKEDDRVVAKFTQVGIDCFPTYTPQSTEMCLDYPTSNPDIRSLSVNGLAGAITVGEVENLAMRSAVISSSLRGEVGLDVIRFLKEKKVFLGADMQGFVRVLQGKSLVYLPWEEMKTTLAYLDVLKSDAVEAEYLTGEKDIYKAAEIYAGMGPKEIVLTHKDGLLVRADGRNYEMGFYPAQMDGRSGRGDTCVGSYVAMRLSKSAHEAGIWAAAVTSLKMEKLGPFDRSLSDVEFLIHSKYTHGSSN